MMVSEFEEVADTIWRRRGGGRRLAIVGSVHGDETAGAQVIRELLEGDDRVWRRAGDVDLTLAIGNPRALQLGLRHTEDGEDLNRLFGATHGQSSGYEGARVGVLKQHLGHAEVLLDLHQTSCTTPPVAVVHDSPEHLRVAAALGVTHAVVGIEAVYTGMMLSRWMDAQGAIGITVETGQKGTEEAAAAAGEVARRFLTSGGSASATGGKIRRYRLERALPTPGPGLAFARALGNTTHVRAGELLGRYEGGELLAPSNAVVFLPSAGAEEGAPCMLLATDEGVITV
jgi:predicted deacylase